jgi:predicted nucleic acid-binding protein
MPRVINIETYQPRFNENLFFDNNVWMFLFCPLASYEKRKQKAYAELLKKVAQNKAAIFINALVISEFCNQWLRMEFNSWTKKFSDPKEYKKDFIPTPVFKNAVSDVKDALNKILSITERGSDNFQAIDLDKLFKEFGNSDFNDSYYVELAHLNNWKIVTDDADFFRNNSHNIDIITANIR